MHGRLVAVHRTRRWLVGRRRRRIVLLARRDRSDA